MRNQRQRPDALRASPVVVRLEEDGDPVVRLEGGAQEPQRRVEVDRPWRRSSVLGQHHAADERRLLTVDAGEVGLDARGLGGADAPERAAAAARRVELALRADLRGRLCCLA